MTPSEQTSRFTSCSLTLKGTTQQFKLWNTNNSIPDISPPALKFTKSWGWRTRSCHCFLTCLYRKWSMFKLQYKIIFSRGKCCIHQNLCLKFWQFFSWKLLLYVEPASKLSHLLACVQNKHENVLVIKENEAVMMDPLQRHGRETYHDYSCLSLH